MLERCVKKKYRSCTAVFIITYQPVFARFVTFPINSMFTFIVFEQIFSIVSSFIFPIINKGNSEVRATYHLALYQASSTSRKDEGKRCSSCGRESFLFICGKRGAAALFTSVSINRTQKRFSEVHMPVLF
jgi:hypothetical protein